MIAVEKAEEAVDFLRESAKAIETLWEQARMKESMVKHVEALLVKSFHEGKTPATVCKEYARATERYVEAITEDAQATAALKGLEARRDAAKITIGLYQSQVKDRL
jgi:hypothetical protein